MIAVTSCEKDDDLRILQKTVGHNLKMNIVSYETLKQSSLITQNTQGLFGYRNKSADSTGYGIQIDTSRIQVLESDFYKSYTFQVVQDSLERQQVLKNYVLTVYNDSTLYQFTIDYPVLQDGIYDINNAMARNYAGNRLYKNDVNGCGWNEIAVTSWRETCVETTCKGMGKHTVSQGATCTRWWGTSNGATRTCTGGWVTRCQSGGGTSHDPFGTDDNPGGSGPTDRNDSGEPDEIGTTPNDGGALDVVETDPECKKIANNLKATDSTSTTAKFKNKLRQMADSVKIYTGEISYGMFKDDMNLERRGGAAGTASNSMNANPSSNYTSYAHVHNNDSIGTLAVFSFDDLSAFAKQLSNDKIDSGSFTAFLSTHHGDDGQHFALTIDDLNKFRAYFNTKFPYNLPTGSTTAQTTAHNTLINSYSTTYLFTTYKYWAGTDALITHTETDPKVQLKQFMKFLNETDMGITLFKTDKNFNNFKKLTYNATSNNITETSCD
ncbi:hypothetical protein BST92_05535 [Nonlabens arenilitoris]|uniref:Uncharacterized protein n=1 Tax=Nonlabens arenilitoris TaxID=1217969 RepID=A0A2S7U907_9FLAO|nr:hypothetical protein BST92_05535 [Nonlabens arenilitoris]